MDNLGLADFLIKYQTPEIPSLYPDESLEQTIVNKKEFWNIRLPKYENKPDKKGELMKHQLIIQRLLSGHTLYDEILLFHEAGTGKTCSTVGVIEGCRANNLGFTKALVIAGGKPLLDNYLNELVFVCTDGKYDPDSTRLKKKVGDFYDFLTFQTFAKKLKNMSESEIRREYDNSIIVIDEVHNLRPNDEDDGVSPYAQLYRLIHLLRNRKVILASATPMRDQPWEIADIMNLILPSDNQMITGGAFRNTYLKMVNEKYYFVKENKEEELAEYFRGRISYLKAQISDVKKQFVGKRNNGMKYFITDSYEMKKLQQKHYNQAIAKDTGEKDIDSDDEEQIENIEEEDEERGRGLYPNSRQASLMVFPDGTWGAAGFKNFIVETKQRSLEEDDKFIRVYRFKKEFLEIFRDKNTEESLKILEKYSIKYSQTIRRLIESKDKSSFVYIDRVTGSGALVFSLLLRLFGFKEAKGGENSMGLRYALLTGKTSTSTQIKNIVKTFNKPENREGGIIRVIIGSSVVSEGLSFKNVQRIHILTPHWNYSETEQAIGRGLRLFSHKDLGPNIIVKIYQYIAESSTTLSIDAHMYMKSEKKDVSIKNMEHLIKISAIDCALTRKRNVRDDTGQRGCDYMDCDYECMYVNIQERENDYSSYNSLYSDSKADEISIVILNKLAESDRIDISSFAEENKDVYTFYEILEAVRILINKNSSVRNSVGLLGWVKEIGGVIYLAPEFNSISYLEDNYYISRPYLFIEKDLQKIESEIFYKSVPKIIDRLIKTRNEEELRSIIVVLPVRIQMMFLETAVIAEEKDIEINEEFRSRLLQFFQPYLKKVENMMVHNLTEKSRCHIIDSDIWEDCKEEVKEAVEKEKIEEQKKFEKSEYGYYGIYNQTTGEFLIRDVSTEETIKASKKSKQSRGKVCKSWGRDDISKIAHSLKLNYDPKEFNGKSKEDIIKMGQTGPKQTKYKHALNAYTDSQLKAMTKEEVERIFYWAGKGKSVSCKAIKDWFETNDLMQIEV